MDANIEYSSLLNNFGFQKTTIDAYGDCEPQTISLAIKSHNDIQTKLVHYWSKHFSLDTTLKEITTKNIRKALFYGRFLHYRKMKDRYGLSPGNPLQLFNL